jgi:hypothetical protein
MFYTLRTIKLVKEVPKLNPIKASDIIKPFNNRKLVFISKYEMNIQNESKIL